MDNATRSSWNCFNHRGLIDQGLAQDILHDAQTSRQGDRPRSSPTSRLIQHRGRVLAGRRRRTGRRALSISRDFDAARGAARSWFPPAWPACTARCPCSLRRDRPARRAGRSAQSADASRTCASPSGENIVPVVAAPDDQVEALDQRVLRPGEGKAWRTSSASSRSAATRQDAEGPRSRGQLRADHPLRRSRALSGDQGEGLATSTSSPSRTSSRSATGWTARSTKWRRRRCTSPTPIISRVKVMANLNIAERRLPQDGRIVKQVGDKQVDMRVSTLPTQHGESRRAPGARPLVGQPLAREPRPAELHLRLHQRDDREAERHLHRHRPDRRGQDHHALRRAPPHQHHRLQAAHRRGPGRI